MQLSEDEWRKRLTSAQYHILREKGTEAPFSGELLHRDDAGNFICAACGAALFASKSKYESSVTSLKGWPSFADVVQGDAVRLFPDNSLGMTRTEVVCANCGSHLGHLFKDGSSPTGNHYCINSLALNFKEKGAANGR